MKKIIVLLSLLFLTGCNVTYEIQINNNKIEEKLVLIENNKDLFDVENDTGWTLRELFDSLINDDDPFYVKEYSTKSLNTENQLGVEYFSDKTIDFENSSAINQCYTNPVFEVDENIVHINTGNNFNCYEYYENLETIQVILTTNHKVISSNAEVVEGNKYIWNITKDGNKNIEISYEQSTSKNSNTFTIILIVVFFGLILGLGYYMYKKSKQENKI